MILRGDGCIVVYDNDSTRVMARRYAHGLQVLMEGKAAWPIWSTMDVADSC